MDSRSARERAAEGGGAGERLRRAGTTPRAVPGRLPGEVWQVVSTVARSRAFVVALGVLLTLDALMIFLHVLHDLRDMGLLSDSRWAGDRRLLLNQDRGYGEIWGYAKGLAAAAAFVAIAWKRRAPVFAALGFTFALIVLDDSLMLHETYGHRLAAALALESRWGLRDQDFGEVLVWAALGSVVVAALVYGFWRSRRQARVVAAIFCGLIAALVFFAVAVDMLHIALTDAFRGAHRVLPLIEESGELVVLSLTCAGALALVRWQAPGDPVSVEPIRRTLA